VPFSQWSPRNASLVALHAGNGNLSAVAAATVLEIIENALDSRSTQETLPGGHKSPQSSICPAYPGTD
jgi:hypothetical protein